MAVLIRHLPEDSATKRAMRGQDWGLGQHLAAGMWNELKALRADLTKSAYHPVLSPSALAEQRRKVDGQRRGHDDLMALLRGKPLVAEGS